MPLRNEKPLEDREFPDDEDLDLDEDDDVVGLSRCLECGELIYADAVKCPHCGQWIVESGQQWRRSRKWYVRGGLYLAKTLLINWIFWLVVAVGISSLVALYEFWLHHGRSW